MVESGSFGVSQSPGIGIPSTVENPISRIKDGLIGRGNEGVVSRPGIGGGVIDVSPYIQGFPGLREGVELTSSAVSGLLDEAIKMSRQASIAVKNRIEQDNPKLSNPPWVSPPVVTPGKYPFTGGQSPSVPYRVVGTITERKTDPRTGEFLGDTYWQFDRYLGNSGPYDRIDFPPGGFERGGNSNIAIAIGRAGSSASDAAVTNLWTGAYPLYGNGTITGISVRLVRDDGLPDVGGNPPPIVSEVRASPGGMVGSFQDVGLGLNGELDDRSVVPGAGVGAGALNGSDRVGGISGDIPGSTTAGRVSDAGLGGVGSPAATGNRVFDGFGTDITDTAGTSDIGVGGVPVNAYVPGTKADIQDRIFDNHRAGDFSPADGSKTTGEEGNKPKKEPEWKPVPLPICVDVGLGCKPACDTGDAPLLEGEFRAKRTCETTEEEMAVIPWGGNGWYGLQNAFKALDLKLAYLEQLICNQECISAIPAWWERSKRDDCPQYELLMRSREKVGLKYEYRYFYIPNPVPIPDDKSYPTWVTGNINAKGYYPDGRSISVYVDSESEGEMVISYLHTKTSYSSPPDITIVKTNRQVSQIEYVPYLVRYKTPENKFGEYVFETRIMPKGEPSPNV